MKTVLATAAMAAAIFTAAAPAHAGNYTGNQWLAECMSQDVANNLKCSAYARGLADGMTWTSAEFGGNCSSFFIDSAVTNRQLVEVGIAYMRSHVANQHDAAALLTDAFSKAWSCRDHNPTQLLN